MATKKAAKKKATKKKATKAKPKAKKKATKAKPKAKKKATKAKPKAAPKKVDPPPAMLTKRVVGFMKEAGDMPTQAHIKVSDIFMGNNVRVHPSWKKDVAKLAGLLKTQGQLQPVLVRKLPKPKSGKKFELYYGARRVEAIKLNKGETVFALVTNREYVGGDLVVLKLMENSGRKGLSSLDEAFAFKQLVDDGARVKDIAITLSLSPGLVSQRLALLNLDPKVQTAIRHGEITPTHARELVRIKDLKQQVALLDKIVKRGLEAQQLKEEVDAIVAKDPNRKEGKPRGRPVKKPKAIRTPDDVSSMLLRYDEKLTKANLAFNKSSSVVKNVPKPIVEAIKGAEQKAYLKGVLIGITWSFDKNSELK